MAGLVIGVLLGLVCGYPEDWLEELVVVVTDAHFAPTSPASDPVEQSERRSRRAASQAGPR